MDLSKFTIPPELFYSKSPSDIWKPPKSAVKVTPVQISKKLKKNEATKRVPLHRVSHQRKKYSTTSVPQLGRIGKLSRSFIKKKLLKKKLSSGVLKESGNVLKFSPKNLNSNSLKLPTKKEERIFLKETQEKEQSNQKRLFSIQNYSRKRFKGSSFKFFKSKNGRESEDETSEENDDLVPEIRDFSDNQSTPKADVFKPNSTAILLDPAPFEAEDEVELEKTTVVIESLLKELDETDEIENAPQNESENSELTLDSLIATLEGSPNTLSKYQEVKAVATDQKRKNKKMGFGENQLQIDAGQKKFGFVECKECGFSYNTNVPEDERIHNKHHQAVTSIPRFRGWQAEDALMIKDWQEQNGRIIHLHPNHKNISSDFVKEIVSQMEMEFGVQDDFKNLHVYLAVYDMKIIGLATVKESVTAKMESEEKCVRLGVQRLFVRPEFRRKGFAKTLLKTITILHHKGELLSLKDDVAFSSPTDDGKKLIESLLGSNKFFVYSS